MLHDRPIFYCSFPMSFPKGVSLSNLANFEENDVCTSNQERTNSERASPPLYSLQVVIARLQPHNGQYKWKGGGKRFLLLLSFNILSTLTEIVRNQFFRKAFTTQTLEIMWSCHICPFIVLQSSIFEFHQSQNYLKLTVGLVEKSFLELCPSFVKQPRNQVHKNKER